MSRLDDFEEILNSCSHFRIDSEAFKKDNLDFKSWLKEFLPAYAKKIERAIVAASYVVHQYPVRENSPFWNSALYIVSEGIAEDRKLFCNKVDMVIVGTKKESIDDRMIDLFKSHIDHVNSQNESPLKINLKIDESGKTIKQWEYQQALKEERYIFVRDLRIE